MKTCPVRTRSRRELRASGSTLPYLRGLAAAQLSGESRRRGLMTFVPASQVLAVLDDERGLIVDAVAFSDLPIVFVAL